MKVLMVLTSHDQLGNTGRKTGFWLEELAAPYDVFKDTGAQITLASPKGGRPPLDPKSNEPSFQTDIADGSGRMPRPTPSSTGRCASIASRPGLRHPAISREQVNFGDHAYPYLAASGVTISAK